MKNNPYFGNKKKEHMLSLTTEFFNNIKYTMCVSCRCNYCNNAFIKYKLCVLLIDKIKQYYFDFYIPIEIQYFISNIVVTYDLNFYEQYINKRPLWPTYNVRKFQQDIETIFKDPDLRQTHYEFYVTRYEKYCLMKRVLFLCKINSTYHVIKKHKKKLHFSKETFIKINENKNEILNHSMFTHDMYIIYLKQFIYYDCSFLNYLREKMRFNRIVNEYSSNIKLLIFNMELKKDIIRLVIDYSKTKNLKKDFFGFSLYYV